MRFAHISDLHFGSFTINPFQFFSKRWTGNFNYFLCRKKEFDYDQLLECVQVFKEEKITHIFISGDLSVTSRTKEFKQARKFIDFLQQENFTVFTVPGNHDHYTKKSAKKKHYYDYFDKTYDKSCLFNLKEHRITYTLLQKNWWLIGLDTAIATPLLSAQGLFSPSLEKNLSKVLQMIPKEEKIILFTHYPLFQNEASHKQLNRAPALQQLLTKYPNICLYLHGHTHRQIVADLRPSSLPIICDSGCTPHIKEGSFHLFEIQPALIKLNVYRYKNKWNQHTTHQFKYDLA